MALGNWNIIIMCTTILIKICSKCKLKKPTDCFYKDKRAKDGLCSQCSTCMAITTKQWQKTHQHNVKKAVKKYRQSNKYKVTKQRNNCTYRNSISGYLQEVYHHIKQRCNNPDTHNYSNYGGRGIQNKFNSLNEFRDYVMNELQIDPRDLQIDRINNNGHYKPGNIRFVTAKENINNRR